MLALAICEESSFGSGLNPPVSISGLRKLVVEESLKPLPPIVLNPSTPAPSTSKLSPLANCVPSAAPVDRASGIATVRTISAVDGISI